MSRSERLLDLLQTLRRHRQPVSGETLARALGISIRTLYRDIVTLQGQGADIVGEPGMGYVLKPGFMLPPLMFSEDELEALVLGSRWVAKRSGGGSLGQAAENALAKIASVLPPDLRERLDTTNLLVGSRALPPVQEADLSEIRLAIRSERKLHISYTDEAGHQSERTIWPFALGFFDHVRIVLAWCEAREDFRSFRTDRISTMTKIAERYPKRKGALLKAWKERENISDKT
jgi:predicted DNA-binding transcriptional regulator YafY